MPTTKQLRIAFQLADEQCTGGRVASFVAAAALEAFYSYEATKWHLTMSYAARLCRREGYSKCAKIMILKKLWGRLKTTDGMDALDDLPDCPEDGDNDAGLDGNSDIDGDGTLVALQPGETSVPQSRATFDKSLWMCRCVTGSGRI